MSNRIVDALQPFVAKGHLAGAVTLVASKDKVLALDALGWIDVAAQKPMTPDALFWIASMTKPMTAAAVMMLVDEDRLSLDDAVEKYLPEFKDQMVIAEQTPGRVVLKKPAHPCTIREALSHTSGLAFKSPMEVPTLDRLTIEDATRSNAAMPLVYEPGTKYQYSNAGINTAARALEVVAGTSYEEFLKKRLLKPLGMKDTTFRPAASALGRVAKPYKVNAAKSGIEETRIDQLSYPLSDRRRQPMPAGGLFSTAADVARFGQMILRGGELSGRRYLSEATVRAMTTKQTPATLSDAYGLGFGITPISFGHGGAHWTDLTIYPDWGIVTVYMVAHVDFPTDDPEVRNPNFAAFKQAVKEEFGKR